MKRGLKKDGYTIPTAMLLMLLLFAFAIGALMFAAYNYNNANKRHEKLQTYLYSKNILDECEYAIMEGDMNQFIAKLVGDVQTRRSKDNVSYSDVYQEEYHFKVALQDTGMLINAFDQEEIDIEMFVTYKPNESGKKLPAKESEYISVGDWIEVEFRIGKTEKRSGNAMEYQILSDFYCSHDYNKNSDGSLKDHRQEWKNMKWQPFQHTGKIYTE